MEIKHRIQLIQLLPSNPVTVELGVAEGNFSFDICEQWNPSIHYAVDNWATTGTAGDGAYEQKWHNENKRFATERLSRFEQVVIHQGITWDVAKLIQDESVDLVYIDAGHDYDSVTKDIKAWFPKVKVGGIMAFHDYYTRAYGVKEAVEDFCRGRRSIHEIPEIKAEDGGCYFIK